MTTSLQEQLQRLALPQTTLLTRNKTRPSLLFDPKEAAGLNRETVYQIGLDGLQELIAKHAVFEQFKNTLFHITSKNFERSVQTAEGNAKLDKNIKRFLLLLSPYFGLSCTHKTLEWLINRFSIHEYNREHLLMLILPYHESNIFVRVIQLMKFKDTNDKWFFLKSLQKPGVHLTKENLLHHAASSPYFLKFVAKFISALIKIHEKPSSLTIAFNFYCMTYIGAIEYSQSINENQIIQMLPALLPGLNSDIPDYCAASYLIAARLLAKTSLSDNILDRFVEKVSKAKVERVKTESALLLIVLYQSQKHYETVPDAACANLAKKDWLPKILEDLNCSGCYIWTFVEKLVKASIQAALKTDEEFYRSFVDSLLAAIKFDEEFVGTFLDALLDAVKSKKKYPEHLQKWLTVIVETVERQYPQQFDKEVCKILSSTQEEKRHKHKRSLQKIFKETMMLKDKFDVFDKLYHSNSEFRTEAVKYLTKNFNSLREGEKETIKSSLIDRLNDDSITVVKETLSLAQQVTFLDKDILKSTLIKLSEKCQKDMTNWGSIATQVVVFLCEISPPDDWETFLAIFPYLLPTSGPELKRAVKVSISPFAVQNPLLKLSRTNNLKLAKNCEEFGNRVFGCLKNDNLDFVKGFVEALQKTSLENRDVFHKYVATLVLSHILPQNCAVELVALVVNIFVSYFESSEVKLAGDDSIESHLDVARKGKFSLEAFYLCLNRIVMKTENPAAVLTTTEFCENSHFNQYFTLVASVLFKKYPICKQYSHSFLQHFCPDTKSRIEFLLNLTVCGNEILNLNFQKNCIETVIALLRDTNIDTNSFTKTSEVLIPYLLELLLNESEEVRRKGLEAIEIVTSSSTQKSDSYVLLLKGLLKQSEEIILDEEQMPLVVFNILSASKSQQASIIRNALVRTACCPESPIYLKAAIVTLLSHINTFDIFENTAQLGLELLKTDATLLDPFRSLIVTKIIMRCEATIAADIRVNSNAWNFVESALRNDRVRVVNEGETGCVAVLLLNQLNKEFFLNLDSAISPKILDIIIETATLSQNPDVLPATSQIFKHIDLDANAITQHFVNMRNVQSPKLDPNKLKRRVNITPTIDILDTLEWRKGVSVLEFIQDKKKIRGLEVLLPILFDVLKRCLDFDEQSAVEYPKQLILSSILHCCSKLDQDGLPENVFNIELIVHCIRASQNPQTHHHALLVLACSATLFPTQVLHHIMAIFTFMGSSVLRHDDAYSYQIISRIIETIIPILVKDGSRRTIAKVLRVFVDALLDVPEHRRVTLYRQLLTTIGVKDILHIFLLLIFESQVFHNNRVAAGESADDTNKRLDIAASFCREFSPDVVIFTCIKLLQYLKTLPDENADELEADDYEIKFVTIKQFRHFKYVLVTFTTNLLASQEFVSQVAALNTDEGCALEQLYKDAIVNVLTYIQRISKVAERHAATPQGRYWKVMLHYSYDILDSVNALLTPQMFLLVVKGLISHNFSTVRRRALELLNSKLQYNSSFFDECEQSEFNSLLHPLITIIQTVKEPNLESDQELIVQTSLLSLKLLVKILALQSPEKFLDIFEFFTGVLKSGKPRANVLASIVLCLAEFCVNLRSRSIPNLPNLMPALIKILKQERQQDAPSLLLLSALTALQKILDTLPLFLSPYLEKLLVELALLTTKWSGDVEDQKLQPLLNKLTLIRQKVGLAIPSRVLIPIVQQSYDHSIERSAFNAIGPLMDVLAENLSNLTGSEISANLPELTNFFLNALQFRADGRTSHDEANVVEGQIVKALITLILKLSESNFRPMYYKFYDWAVRGEVSKERLITFYSLTSGIAECLKGLFGLFAGHFLNNAAQILDACNNTKADKLFFEDDARNILLLENVLKTFLSVFTYDTHKFINKDRFEVLMQPLVDQLDNTLGEPAGVEERNRKLLTPCIVQFAVATADDSLWKQLNYQILLKMRDTAPSIRLVALNCLTEIVRKLGEDFLPLLPETIPFLAELLEDEEENVEKACRKSVQEMEKVLGEPLQKYF